MSPLSDLLSPEGDLTRVWQEVTSVLVHGSDGMDSTLQVSSLAQLILNPDCRTIRG